MHKESLMNLFEVSVVCIKSLLRISFCHRMAIRVGSVILWPGFSGEGPNDCYRMAVMSGTAILWRELFVLVPGLIIFAAAKTNSTDTI